MALMKGMKPWSTDQIRLKFGNYVEATKLPPVPHRFGHVGASAPPVAGGWQMLGNDRAGDCVVAGAAHGQMVWNWATRKPIPTYNDAVILQQYFALTGGPDTGLDPVEVASWWKHTGIRDAHDQVYRIRSYTALATVDQAITATYLFGFAGLGLYLPRTADSQFVKGQVWDDLSAAPNQNAGHYVPLVGRNSVGNLMVVTWGRLQAMTPAWFSKYFMGGVAYTSEAYMLASGLSPEGFNFSQLDADLAALS